MDVVFYNGQGTLSMCAIRSCSLGAIGGCCSAVISDGVLCMKCTTIFYSRHYYTIHMDGGFFFALVTLGRYGHSYKRLAAI